MLNILKQLWKGLGKTTKNGLKEDSMFPGCSNTETNTDPSSPYDIEIKKVQVKKITLKK